MDIFAEIERDHLRFRKLLARVADPEAPIRARRAALHTFWPSLKAQAIAEEKTLYWAAKRKRALKKMCLEAMEEHATIAAVAEKALRTARSQLWQARAKLFCELLAHHLDGEEDVFMVAAMASIGKTQRHELAQRYRDFYPDQVRAPYTAAKLLAIQGCRPHPEPLHILLP